MNVIEVVDPSGGEPTSAGLAGAPRPSSLAGRRVGVLDNGKPNADHVVRSLAGHLHERFGARTAHATGKVVSSRPCPDEVLVGFRGIDVAVVGVGD